MCTSRVITSMHRIISNPKKTHPIQKNYKLIHSKIKTQPVFGAISKPRQRENPRFFCKGKNPRPFVWAELGKTHLSKRYISTCECVSLVYHKIVGFFFWIWEDFDGWRTNGTATELGINPRVGLKRLVMVTWVYLNVRGWLVTQKHGDGGGRETNSFHTSGEK